MKRNLLIGTIALLAGSLLQASASPKDELTTAAKKLADKDNYSWKQETVNAGGGGFGAGAGKGKIEKGGYLWLSMKMRDNTVEAVKKADKGAIKIEDEWQSLSDAASGDPGPATFVARRLQNFKSPAAQAEDLAGKVSEVKRDGDVYSGDLTEEGAKSQLMFGGRGGGNGPEISEAKGSVKFWVKDGLLSKYELKVQGKVSFNGNDRNVDRTTTVEIQDIGSTKVEVPDEAKKKLSS
ncbi:MAG: hypothetical protein C5B50_25570 [Verrucomicrobia bacterium]|nr:MAG: hypothetical protein C5B50_25570 [Verrucomicrobiota bacterium]